MDLKYKSSNLQAAHANLATNIVWFIVIVKYGLDFFKFTKRTELLPQTQIFSSLYLWNLIV